MNNLFNATYPEPIYSSVERSILPLAGLVVCPIMSIIVYLVARKRTTQLSSIRSKSYLFYRILSGVLLGQFIGHTVWSSDSTWMLIFVAVGYFVLDTLEIIGRMWTSNPNILAEPDYMFDEDETLIDTNECDGEVLIVDDVTGDTMQVAVFETQQKNKFISKRQWMLFLLLILFAVIAFVNGLYLIYRLPQTTMEKTEILICYFVNALSMSTAVYGGMIHARIHTDENKRRRLLWWFSLTLIWSVIFFAPTIMVLALVDWTWVNTVVHNSILLGFYGASCGALLKMQSYFHMMNQRKVDRRELWAGIAVFLVAVGQSMATSIWL